MMCEPSQCLLGLAMAVIHGHDGRWWGWVE